MTPLKKESLEATLQRFRDRFSYENLTKLSKYAHLTRQKHKELLKSFESLCFLLLDSYLRNSGRLKDPTND